MMNCSFSSGQLIIKGELQVAFLDSLMDCLEKALPLDQAVEVDLSRVEAVDVAGLQALLAFIRGRQDVGPLKFTGTPPIFHKALEITGLKDDFAEYIAS
jgi:ABC-type transporter Mla MlaB component